MTTTAAPCEPHLAPTTAPTASCSSRSSSDGTGASDACPSLQTPSRVVLDAGDGVVCRVAALGPLYWQWINEPEAGQPRFFAHPVLEACSKTPWWVVPLLWLPLFGACSASATAAHGLPAHAAVSLALCGVVAWQLLEYVIHRFVFHAHVTSAAGITLHFLFHGCHHKYPMDRLRLVFPPLPASALVGAVYLALHAMLPRGPALALFAGMGYGYVLYDCLHYAMHHGGGGGGGGGAGSKAGTGGGGGASLTLAALVSDLRSRHFDHHYRDDSHGFGISSMLFDIILGTGAKVAP